MKKVGAIDGKVEADRARSSPWSLQIESWTCFNQLNFHLLTMKCTFFANKLLPEHVSQAISQRLPSDFPPPYPSPLEELAPTPSKNKLSCRVIHISYIKYLCAPQLSHSSEEITTQFLNKKWLDLFRAAIYNFQQVVNLDTEISFYFVALDLRMSSK